MIEEYQIKEQKLLQKIDKLEKINQTLNEFVYTISHDLKAPLRGISSVAQWLFEDYADKLDEEFTENLQLLIDRSRHADEMIQSLLAYSRVSNKVDDLEDCDVNELCQGVIDSIDINNQQSIEISKNIPSIRFSKTLLYHILQNLISNGLKYSSKDNGKVTVYYNDDQEHYHTLIIEDNGIGIDKKHHDDIFKIFYVIDPSNKESSGIGLSIVKKIIENFCGTIKIESQIGEGTRMIITIPKEIENYIENEPELLKEID